MGQDWRSEERWWRSSRTTSRRMDRWSSRKLCVLTWKGWNGSPRSERHGGVAEWTKAAALKAVEGLVPSVGSNPTPSATPGVRAFRDFPRLPCARQLNAVKQVRCLGGPSASPARTPGETCQARSSESPLRALVVTVLVTASCILHNYPTCRRVQLGSRHAPRQPGLRPAATHPHFLQESVS